MANLFDKKRHPIENSLLESGEEVKERCHDTTHSSGQAALGWALGLDASPHGVAAGKLPNHSAHSSVHSHQHGCWDSQTL